MSANPGSQADPDDPQDAIYTAANMLSADGAPAHWSKAIYAYNHAQWYVNEIESGASNFLGPTGLSNLTAAINAAWGSSTRRLVSDTSSPTDSGCPSDSTGTLDVNPVPGESAVIMPDGLARPGADAPKAVKAMVDAGDRIDSESLQLRRRALRRCDEPNRPGPVRLPR